MNLSSIAGSSPIVSRLGKLAVTGSIGPNGSVTNCHSLPRLMTLNNLEVVKMSEGQLYDKIYKLMHDSLNKGECPSFREMKQILDETKTEFYTAWTAGPSHDDSLREIGITIKKQFGRIEIK